MPTLEDCSYGSLDFLAVKSDCSTTHDAIVIQSVGNFGILNKTLRDKSKK